MTKTTKHLAGPIITLALLAGMVGTKLSRATSIDAEPYHQRVRSAIEAIPLHIGDWTSTGNLKIPQAAIALLKPNAILNRRYYNYKTNRSATLLIVHCKDARDLAGHYPPICYPANGYTEEVATAKDWQLDNLAIPGMEYVYSRGTLEGRSQSVVENFMILPDGQVCRDMQGVRRAASDYTKHFFGAAQIQLLFDNSIPPQDRTDIFKEILGPNLAVLQTMRAGVMQ